MSNSMWLHKLCSPWNFPCHNTEVGSLSLHQGIFPTQGQNPGLPHCRWILYQLSHKESPRIVEWVAFPFSRGSSQPRDRTHVSCIAGRLFTNWAMKETHIKYIIVDIIYMIYQIYNVYEIYNYIYEIYNYKIFRKK